MATDSDHRQKHEPARIKSGREYRLNMCNKTTPNIYKQVFGGEKTETQYKTFITHMQNTGDAEDEDGWQIAMYHENINVFIVDVTSDRLVCRQHVHPLMNLTQSPLLNRPTVIIAYLHDIRGNHYCPVYKQGNDEADDVFMFPYADKFIQNLHKNYRICCQTGDREHLACNCGELDEFDGYVSRNIPECVKMRDIGRMTRPNLIRLAKQCGIPQVGKHTADLALYNAVNTAREMYEDSRYKLSDLLNIDADAAMDLIDHFRSIPNVLDGDVTAVEKIIKGRYTSNIDNFKTEFKTQKEKQMSIPLTEYEKDVLLLSKSGYDEQYMIDSIHLKNTLGADTTIMTQFGELTESVKRALRNVLSIDVVRYNLALENIARDLKKNTNLKGKSSREDAGKQKEETYKQRQHAMIQQHRIEHAVTARTEQLRMDTEKAQMDAEEAILAKDKAAQKVQRQAVLADVRAKKPPKAVSRKCRGLVVAQNRPCEQYAIRNSDYCHAHTQKKF